MQDKYEKALRGPVKKTMRRDDGQEYELEGMPSHPTFRRLAGVFDVQGNWIPRVPETEKDTLYVEIMHYKVTETVSWMLGGYDELVMLKDENKRPYQVKFGLPAGAKALPAQRPHRYEHHAVTEKEYRFIAIPAGLPDENAAFAATQELGAWTMDLLWTEVMNSIARVEAYTKKDDPTVKAKTKENVKGNSVVPQSQFMRLYEGDGEGKNEERLANYFETGYGYARPNYNTMEDRSRKEVFGLHMNEDEIPFTAGDLPEKFFEEPKRASTTERVIPTVPEFVAKDRPSSKKMIHPEYKDTCLRSN
eukprot:5615545-Amphidinium_carterae.2